MKLSIMNSTSSTIMIHFHTNQGCYQINAISTYVMSHRVSEHVSTQTRHLSKHSKYSQHRTTRMNCTHCSLCVTHRLQRRRMVVTILLICHVQILSVLPDIYESRVVDLTFSLITPPHHKFNPIPAIIDFIPSQQCRPS